MSSISNNGVLSNRTVLVSPNEASREIATHLAHYGARVLPWPALDIGEPENYEALDEALENLFGYDWLIFQNEHAADFFLSRFRALSHEISELDALRVCAASEEAVKRLEALQVHIDIIQDRLSSPALCDAVANYAGGREALSGLNFLFPTTSIARSALPQMLAEAGARVDAVVGYRTVTTGDPAPARLNALLTGGGIDCIVFNNSPDVHNFAQVFSTGELAPLLSETTVACVEFSASQAAADFGLRVDFIVTDPSMLAGAICRHFGEI